MGLSWTVLLLLVTLVKITQLIHQSLAAERAGLQDLGCFAQTSGTPS